MRPSGCCGGGGGVDHGAESLGHGAGSTNGAPLIHADVMPVWNHGAAFVT